MSQCPVCKGAAEMSEVTKYPFACHRCVCKHAEKIKRAQDRSIKFWRETCCEKRSPAARQRWSESIERGLKKLGI